MAGKLRVVRKVKIGDSWVFAKVPFKNNQLDFKHVVFKGELLSATEGTFHLDYQEGGKRRRPAIGNDAAAVKRALTTQAHVLELRRRGIEAADAPEIQGSKRVEGESLRGIAAAFKAHPPARLARRSIANYSYALQTFADWAASAHITHTSQVDARAIERWMNHLREKEGLDPSTIKDKVVVVAAELRKRGAKIELKAGDLPKPTERERAIYDHETLKQFFAGCKPNEFAMYQTFLLTGMREQEVAYLGWDNVDFKRGTVHVQGKPDLKFTPKNYQERTIPVPRRLIELLTQHRERSRPEARLVFETVDKWVKPGTRGGQRDKKMLEKLKKIAHRLGMNCGHCVGTIRNKTVTCATHPICGRFGLHKFRHTYATSLLRDGVDIISLQKLLGHKDLDSTRKYLRALEPDAMMLRVEESTLSRMFE